MQTQLIQPPHFPRRLRAHTLEWVEEHAEYASLAIAGGDLSRQAAVGVLFEQIRLRHVTLIQTHFARLRVFDARFEACDLSAANWDKARLRRVELIGCRLAGVQLVGAQMDDVLVKDCHAEEAVFASAVFRAARFEQCNLRRASFDGADLTSVVFHLCDLTDANLVGAKLHGADLRGSNINGMRVGVKELQGIIIDPTLAVQVTSLLGITVKDIDETQDQQGAT